MGQMVYVHVKAQYVHVKEHEMSSAFSVVLQAGHIFFFSGGQYMLINRMTVLCDAYVVFCLITTFMDRLQTVLLHSCDSQSHITNSPRP